jgi:hypothetical protein
MEKARCWWAVGLFRNGMPFLNFKLALRARVFDSLRGKVTEKRGDKDFGLLSSACRTFPKKAGGSLNRQICQ